VKESTFKGFLTGVAVALSSVFLLFNYIQVDLVVLRYVAGMFMGFVSFGFFTTDDYSHSLLFLILMVILFFAF